MTTPSIPGFQWLEQLGDGPCGQIHRFTPVATDPRDEPVPVVAVFYHPEGIDPDLLTRQWQEMFAAVAPPGILLPLSWQFTGPKLTALWPDLDRPDALETPAASRANPQTPFTKVRIKPRHSRHTDASGDGPGTAGFNGRLSRWLESPVGRNASGSERTRLTSGLLEAGSWLHQRDLIHGNLKPDNIWLRPAHDGFVFPLLLNIGTGAVGRIVDLPWSDHLLYMPAEQLVGRTGQERHPNAKGWDVHAMGVILHRIWTGRLPRFQQWLESHGNQSPPSDQWRTDAGRPPFLDWGGCSLTKPQQDVVARCLEPDPAKRWQDLEQLAKAWEQALMEASPAAAEVSAAPTVPSVPSEPSVTSPEPATAAPAAKAGFAKSLLLALACMAIGAGLYATAQRLLAPDESMQGPEAAVRTDGPEDEPATSQPTGPSLPPRLPDSLASDAVDAFMLHLIDQRLDGQTQTLMVTATIRAALMDAYRERIEALGPAQDPDQKSDLAVALEIRGHLLALHGQLAAAEGTWGQAILRWQQVLEELAGSPPDPDAGVHPMNRMDAAEARLAAVHEARGRYRRRDGRNDMALADLVTAGQLRNGMLRRAPDREQRSLRTRAAGRCWLTVAEARRESRDLRGAADALAEVDAMLTELLGGEVANDSAIVWLQAGALHQKGHLARAGGEAETAILHQHEAAQLLVDHIARAVVVPLDFQGLLGRVYTELAELSAKLGDPAQAIDAHSAAIRHFFAVLAAEPESFSARSQLARNYGELAFIELDLGHDEEAVQHLRAAVSMIGEVARDPAAPPADILALAVLQASLADLTLQQDEAGEALVLIEQAVNLVSRRLQSEDGPLEGADLTRWRLREAELTDRWAEIALAGERDDRALQALELALERWRVLRTTPGISPALAQRGIQQNRSRLDALMAGLPTGDLPPPEPPADPGPPEQEAAPERPPGPPPLPPLPRLLQREVEDNPE